MKKDRIAACQYIIRAFILIALGTLPPDVSVLFDVTQGLPPHTEDKTPGSASSNTFAFHDPGRSSIPSVELTLAVIVEEPGVSTMLYVTKHGMPATIRPQPPLSYLGHRVAC